MAHPLQDSPSYASFFHGALAVVLLLLGGSTFALGIFIPQVEDFASPPHHLDGLWETAMGAMHLFSAPVMIFAGIFLDAGLDDPLPASLPFWVGKSSRLRLLNLLSAVSFACLAFSGYGAAHSDRFYLLFGVTMQAFPLAIGTYSYPIPYFVSHLSFENTYSDVRSSCLLAAQCI